MLTINAEGGEVKLSDRKEKILACVVEGYIASGEPIGSKSICEELSVSSATVRNEMSELCELGYLEKRHTSSGRIPSAKGYRYYVDNLITPNPLSDEECIRIENEITKDATSPEQVIKNASNVLAELTGCATVFTTPEDKNAQIQKVELIPASKRTAILVLLTSSGILKNCVCRIDIEIDENLKDSFKDIVDKYFIGSSVTEMTPELLQRIIESLGSENYAITPLLSALYSLSKDASQSKTVVESQTNLLAYRNETDNMLELLDFLRSREQSSQLVAYQSTSKSDMLSILIGSENYFSEMSNSSMILARYAFGNREVGTLGIIGPTRIDYSKLIPNVKYLTELVGRVITDKFEDNET